MGLRARRAGPLASSTSGGTDLCTAFAGGVPLLQSTRASPGPLPRREGGVLGRAGEAAPRGRGRRAGDHRADAVDAPLLLERPGRRALPLELLRHVSGRLASRRLDQDHPAWRGRDLRALRLTINRQGVRMGTAEIYSARRPCPRCSTAWCSTCSGPMASRGCRSSWCCARTRASTTTCADGSPAASASTARRGTCPTRYSRSPRCPRPSAARSLEVPVKKILMGTDPDRAASRDSLANPESLDYYELADGCQPELADRGPELGVDPFDQLAPEADRPLERRQLHPARRVAGLVVIGDVVEHVAAGDRDPGSHARGRRPVALRAVHNRPGGERVLLVGVLGDLLADLDQLGLGPGREQGALLRRVPDRPAPTSSRFTKTCSPCLSSRRRPRRKPRIPSVRASRAPVSSTQRSKCPRRVPPWCRASSVAAATPGGVVLRARRGGERVRSTSSGSRR